jgi:hypothetical protein
MLRLVRKLQRLDSRGAQIVKDATIPAMFPSRSRMCAVQFFMFSSTQSRLINDPLLVRGDFLFASETMDGSLV